MRLVPFPDVPGEDVGRRILRSIEALGDTFRDENYDVVHAQDCISANAVPGCLRTVHHLDTFTTPELATCHERAIVQPRALVCVSAAVADEVATGWGRVPTVIPNGVEADPNRANAMGGRSTTSTRRTGSPTGRVDEYDCARGRMHVVSGAQSALECAGGTEAGTSELHSAFTR